MKELHTLIKEWVFNHPFVSTLITGICVGLTSAAITLFFLKLADLTLK